MKKKLAILLAGVMTVASFAGCGAEVTTTDNNKQPKETTQKTDTSDETGAKTEGEAAGGGETDSLAADITLWTYPIGNWGNGEKVDELIAAFNEEYPDVHVTVEYLDYTNGDDQVNTAIEGGKAPDLIMEGPERLVANWGAKGLMVDMSDILTDAAKSEIYDSVLKACINDQGAIYEYPVCMTAHCMAINKTVFEAAGAMEFLDADNHTWTSENFFKAVEKVQAYTNSTVAAIYCSGQGGDQGTRAIVNNLYGGTFTTDDHSAYTADSAENIKALEQLAATEGIKFDASIAGGDEINLFRQGQLNMAFCWNIAQQLNTNNNDAGLTNSGDEILFMAFPSESSPELCGGIWGFGIFDNKDANRIAASKAFITFMADSAKGTPEAVKASTYFPVRDTVDSADLTGLYADNDIMSEYGKLMQYLGDYYQVTPGWTEARTAWWNMLQQIGTGEDVTKAVTDFCAAANAAAQN